MWLNRSVYFRVTHAVLSHPCAALGAVAVAAVGVYGVLQMALMVAQGTGRSIMAEKQASAEQLDAAADRTKPKL